jgi:polysaccharide export outer membrane protein
MRRLFKTSACGFAVYAALCCQGAAAQASQAPAPKVPPVEAPPQQVPPVQPPPQIPSPQAPTTQAPPSQPPSAAAVPKGVEVPAGFVIGPEDVLVVVIWGEKEMSGEVTVRPDGKVTLPLIKDVQAAGYTPEQLTDVVAKAASKFVSNPNVTVVVKAINSRKVFIIGQVAKPGSFLLTGDMTVLELIARAGDILEYAKGKNIVVVRKEQGRTQTFKFNYNDVLKGRRPEQNILLKPGDTVIVP